jgi:hypothetical protein
MVITKLETITDLYRKWTHGYLSNGEYIHSVSEIADWWIRINQETTPAERSK